MEETEYKECPRCAGCGQIASDEEGTPWKYWLELPIKIAQSILLGIVKPLLCPVCKGKGKVPIE